MLFIIIISIIVVVIIINIQRRKEYDKMKEICIFKISRTNINFIELKEDVVSNKKQLTFFMALAGRAKKDNISFSQDEINLIMNVIKDHSSPEEVAKINQTVKLFKNRK